MKLLTKTSPALIDVSFLLLRLALGVTVFAAGAGKVLGWFGGYGMQKSIEFYVSAGIPAFWGYVSTYTEFIGGALIILGLLARPVAIPVAINMLVATIVSWPMGLSGVGFPGSLFLISLAIILSGPMKYSLDALLVKRGGMSHEPAPI